MRRMLWLCNRFSLLGLFFRYDVYKFHTRWLKFALAECSSITGLHSSVESCLTCSGGTAADCLTATCASGHHTYDANTTTCTEMTCANVDGSNTSAACGQGATCSDGGQGDGYVCQCGSGYHGSDVSNGAATCAANECTCENGTPAAGASCSTHEAAICASCSAGYQLNSSACVGKDTLYFARYHFNMGCRAY